MTQEVNITRMLVCKLLTSSTGVSKSNEHHRHDVSYQPMDIQQIPSPKRCRWRRRDAVQAVLRCGLSQDGSCMINKNPTPSTLRIITWDPLLLVVVYHPQLCRKKMVDICLANRGLWQGVQRQQQHGYRGSLTRGRLCDLAGLSDGNWGWGPSS